MLEPRPHLRPLLQTAFRRHDLIVPMLWRRNQQETLSDKDWDKGVQAVTELLTVCLKLGYPGRLQAQTELDKCDVLWFRDKRGVAILQLDQLFSKMHSFLSAFKQGSKNRLLEASPMSDKLLREGLVKLGAEHPELRPHIRPLLAKESGLSLFQKSNVFLQLREGFDFLYFAASKVGKLADAHRSEIGDEAYMNVSYAISSLEPTDWKKALVSVDPAKSLRGNDFLYRACSDALEAVRSIYILMSQFK